MNQSTKMIQRKHLEDLGFIEIKEALFMKQLENGIQLYRDYRDDNRVSYAYKNNKTLSIDYFKEFKAIEVIEKRVNMGTLMAFS